MNLIQKCTKRATLVRLAIKMHLLDFDTNGMTIHGELDQIRIKIHCCDFHTKNVSHPIESLTVNLIISLFMIITCQLRGNEEAVNKRNYQKIAMRPENKMGRRNL